MKKLSGLLLLLILNVCSGNDNSILRYGKYIGSNQSEIIEIFGQPTRVNTDIEIPVSTYSYKIENANLNFFIMDGKVIGVNIDRREQNPVQAEQLFERIDNELIDDGFAFVKAEPPDFQFYARNKIYVILSKYQNRVFVSWDTRRTF